MNSFFANLGPTAVANLPRATFHNTKYIQPMLNSLHKTEVTENKLYSMVSFLASKSSSGFDGLSVKHLKLIFPFISTVLLKIVNKSFASSIFPDILQIARVIPLHKGGDLSDLINFQPISLLSSLSKVFELAKFNKMLSFIDNTIFYLIASSGFAKTIILNWLFCMHLTLLLTHLIAKLQLLVYL